LKEFGDEWDKVAKAIRRLKCPPIEAKPIIEAANALARVAAKIRGAETLEGALLKELNASAEELLRKVELLTVPDKAQLDAIHAIKRFRGKVI